MGALAVAGKGIQVAAAALSTATMRRAARWAAFGRVNGAGVLFGGKEKEPFRQGACSSLSVGRRSRLTDENSRAMALGELKWASTRSAGKRT